MREYLTSWFNEKLLTSLSPGTGRLRVDVAETGFFEGREFRISEELSIAAGATLVYRFTSPVDFILQRESLSIDAGELVFRAYRENQGTAGGTWTTTPSFPNNLMASAPAYTRQATIEKDGTFTPGVGESPAEVIRLRTASSTAQSSTIAGAAGDQRGLAAGTYYLVIVNNGNATTTGTFDLRWEERP